MVNMLCNGSGALGVREKNLHVQQSNEGVVHQSLGKGAITTLWNGALVLMAHGSMSPFSFPRNTAILQRKSGAPGPGRMLVYSYKS